MAIVKNLAFGDEGRAKLIEGITDFARAVKSTLGPRGKTVLMESHNHTQGITITKDGKTVADGIVFLDPIKNLAATLLREASSKTAIQAGDGTTTSVVLTEALVLQAQALIKPHMNQTNVLRHLKIAGEEVLKRLDEMAIAITGDNLKDIATISANGDEELGSLIADAYGKVGIKGVVMAEKSRTSHTYSDVANGVRIEKGWASKYFVTNVAKQECVLINPYILVCDKEIEKMQDIEHLVIPALTEKRSFLVIGRVSEAVLEAMNYNVAKGILQFCVIGMPDISFKGAETLDDIALMTGARYFSEGSGDNMELLQVSDLGTASKVVVGLNHSVIFTNEHIEPEQQSRIEGRIAEIELKIAEETIDSEVMRLKERLANINNGVGIVYVGSSSDIETKERYDRCEDSCRSVACAIEGGILIGGGTALLTIANSMQYGTDEESRVAWHILKFALEAPFKQIVLNGGFELTKTDMEFIGHNGDGFNAATGEIVDLIKAGVVDPALVTKHALQNALSIASTIASTDCIITNERANDRN